MITINADKLAEQLKKIHEETVRKLEHMVQEYVYEVIAEKAVDHTPYGDAVTYAELYERRNSLYSYQERPGLAKGSWSVLIPKGIDMTSTSRSAIVYSNVGSTVSGRLYDTELGSGAKAKMQAQLGGYTLGDTVIVRNDLPYVGGSNALGKGLEAGQSKQAPQGIMGPMKSLIAAYSFPFKDVFDRG
jgi:hypothetical protein